MRLYIIMLLSFCSPIMVEAQVTMSTQLPPAGFVQKDQLWNLILVNNKDELLDVSIRMNLLEAATGQVVLSANSGQIFLGKGVKSITLNDVQPIQYNYSQPDMMRNYIPMGSYIICYQIIRNGNKEMPLTEECVRINIEPLSPPLLNTPSDRTDILSPYPQFSWIPPAPFEMFNFLTYDLVVTEVLPGQSPAEAINGNNPLYYKTGVLNNADAYPSSLPALDTGKIYAWNIVAKNNQDYAAKSEVWTFKIRGTQTATIPDGEYFLLRNDINAIYHLTGKRLLVKFFSYSSDYDSNLFFVTGKGATIRQEKIHVKNGNNYFEFELGSRFKTEQTYTLQFNDKLNKINLLRFKITK